MKRFNEIANFRKIEVKTDYCALKTALYNTNGIILKYIEAFAFPELVEAADKELCAAFEAMKAIKLTEKHEREREKMIDCGRYMIRSLRAYLKTFTYGSDCVNAAVTTAKFQVRDFLNSKKTMTIERGLEFMKRNQLVYAAIKSVEQNCKTKVDVGTFYRLQDDVRNLIDGRLDSYAFA